MKVLIVGLGSIAGKHILSLKALLNSVEIFALRSTTNQSEVEGVQNIYSIEDIEKINPDFAIISNPTGNHFQVIDDLKRFRIPLFIEKPLFSALGRKMENLVNDINDAEIVSYVACNLRFLNCISYFKNEVLDKYHPRIEEVNVYCGSYLPSWRKNVDFRKTYSANKEMGGGVEIDLIHELDYVYWLFGKPQKNSGFFTNHSSLNITANDYANYLWVYPTFSANVILNYYRKIPKRQLEVITDKDVWIVDLLKNTIYKNDEVYYESSNTIVDTYQSQMDFFLNKICSGQTKFNPIDEAYEVLKLCLKN